MARTLQFEGIVEYKNEANNFFVEWATVGGRGLEDLLNEMLGDDLAWSGKVKVKITLEEIE